MTQRQICSAGVLPLNMEGHMAKRPTKSDKPEKLNPTPVEVSGIVASARPEIWAFTGTNKLYKSVAVLEYDFVPGTKDIGSSALVELLRSALSSVLPGKGSIDVSSEQSRAKFVDDVLAQVLKQNAGANRAVIGFINASEAFAEMETNSKVQALTNSKIRMPTNTKAITKLS
jgi:hypothetical protein